ncbi:MAG: hypothetical protein A2V70_03285 [Planctomycetes bacterium RBG_13_63_9]|nr:MAG: hypothetical protein A2V70_03285 [Planctomycetes bacterium RBG_13_63_9]
MADLRIDSESLRGVWLVVLLGAVLCGGSVLFGQTTEAPAAEEKVVEVRLEGNLTVPKEKILSHIRTRVGRAFELEVIEEDVRRLNRTRYFINVEPFTQQVPGGRVVVFRVLERPTLEEIRFVGNLKLKDKVLAKEVDLKAGDASDPFAVEEARRKIEEFYRSKGFSKVRVTAIEGTKPGDRSAVFVINEGLKQRVLWTSFVGNTIASDARLRTQIQSKPGILWYFKGEVDKKQIEEDINRLTAYYRGLGFFDARIGRELIFNASENWLHLTFVIDEGPRFKVRNVSLIGNTKFSTEELTAKLNLKGGQHFNQSQLTKDIAAIQDEYGSDGYIFADVKADPRYLEEPGMLDLVYRIAEGDRWHVGRINVEIRGENPHTQWRTVLDRLSLKPGDIVNIRKLRESERRLQRSQLFDVDMQKGTEPKIVFGPPELEEERTEVARPPKRDPRVRGQSPELVPCGPWRCEPVPQSPPGNRRVDLTLPCRMVVRGQNGYSAEGGWSVPRLQPATPWLPNRQPQSYTVGQVPGSGYPPQVITPPNQPAAPVYSAAPPVYSAAPPVYSAEPSGQPRLTPAGPSYGEPLPPGYESSPEYQGQAGGGAVAGPGAEPYDPRIFGEGSPFADAPGDADPTRPLDLDVISYETHTGRLMFGVGVNSDAGLVGSVMIDEQNFDWARFPRSWEDIRNATAWRGAGQRFRMELIPGTEVQRYTVSFQEPYLLGSEVSLGLSGFFFDRRYREWDEQRLGGRVSLGYQFTHDLSAAFSFRGARINVHDPIIDTLPELNEVLGDNSLYGFGVQLAHDTRDSQFLPTEGHLFEVAMEQVTGSFDYPRAEVDLQRYFLIHERADGSGRHVLSLSTRFGWTGEDTPIYDHFYAGGFTTIRGFEFRGASPQSQGVIVGGHFMLLGSIQYMFPITADDMLRAVVFCDAGTVEPEIDDWSDKFRVAPGLGLRITVPMMGPAPIAVDFAFPIAAEPGDRERVFSFFVGFNK